MFYEEKVINGIVHYRNTPTGNWIPKPKEETKTLLMEDKNG